jgi:hypothetical protein
MRPVPGGIAIFCVDVEKEWDTVDVFMYSWNSISVLFLVDYGLRLIIVQ